MLFTGEMAYRPFASVIANEGSQLLGLMLALSLMVLICCCSISSGCSDQNLCLDLALSGITLGMSLLSIC